VPLFNRTATVTVGPRGADGVTIENLRIAFKVSKTLTPSTNSAQVEIYNANQKTRELLSEIGNLCVLKAGYKDQAGPAVLFIGDVTHTDQERRRPENLIKLECGDGEKTLRESLVSYSFAAGTDPRDILDAIAADMALTVRDVPDVTAEQYATGWQFAGPAKDALDLVCDRLGLEWSIQNDELQFVIDGETTGTEAILLSPTTGLIGSPRRNQDRNGIATAEGPPPGLIVECLLEPRLEPGGRVKIESAEYSGIYRIVTVEHKGDTHGKDWTSRAEVEEVA